MTPRTVEAAALAPAHPALRWTPIVAGERRQHRRTADGSATECGLPGPLTLAEVTDDRCSDCFGTQPKVP